MKIAIDCRPLQNSYALRGVGTVVRNLLMELVKSRVSTSLVLCGKSVVPPMQCGVYTMLKRSKKRDWLSEQLRWPIDLIAMKAGIFHSTVSLGLLREIGFPLVCPVKSIATVYDCIPLHLPDLAPHTKMWSYRLQRMALKNASRVLTISEFVKKEIVELLQVDESKIRVLPLAVDEALAKAYDSRIGKDDDALHEQFVLAMGEGAHKNINTVLEVFKRLADAGYAGNLRVIGALENQTQVVRERFEAHRHKNRIVFTRDISLEQLAANYAHCDFFLFPSLMEGFGLPVLEAMYCGAPVICSNTSSLPEVGGNAAMYCDPEDTQAIILAAQRLLYDGRYRSEVAQKGKQHARRRSWRDAVDGVIRTYEELGWQG